MTIESVVNQALDLIGYKKHITLIYDGSPAARIAIDTWAETRDEILALQQWDFARAVTALVIDAAVPQPPWTFAYTRPDIAIDVQFVYPSNLAVGSTLDPLPTRWLELSAPARVIMTNFTPAAAVITRRVTDTALWTPEFTLMVIRALAEKFEHALMGAKQGGRREQSDDSGRRSE